MNTEAAAGTAAQRILRHKRGVLMRRPEFIARQARCPSGILGQLLGRIMAVETASANDTALELLTIRPHDRVLEIGFGHGRTIARAASQAAAGFVAGVEVSETMLRMATRYNHGLIKGGRVALHLADSRALPYPDGSFDRVFAVHTLYFWTEPEAHFREISRVMKEGAQFLLCFGPQEDTDMVRKFPATVYRFFSTDEVHMFLSDAGFGEFHMVRQTVAARELVFARARRLPTNGSDCGS
jgi:SAM-dependent methyltransferase